MKNTNTKFRTFYRVERYHVYYGCFDLVDSCEFDTKKEAEAYAKETESHNVLPNGSAVDVVVKVKRRREQLWN